MDKQELKKTNFWNFFREMMFFEAPLYQWRTKMGNEINFEKFRETYLNPTDTFEDRIRCTWPCSCKCFSGWRRAVEFDDGSCVAICDEYMGDDVVIDKQDLLYYTAKESALVQAVAKAMGITPYTAKLEQPENTWKVGSINVKGDSIPVFITLKWQDKYLLQLIFNLNRMMHDKYILLGIRQDIMSHGLSDLLHDGGGVFIPLDETLDFNLDAELGLIKALDLASVVLPRSELEEEPENIFRKCGDAWEIRFQGDEKFLLTSADTGARYLHFMLGRPNTSTQIAEIMRKVSGESENYISGEMLGDGNLTEGYSFGDMPNSNRDNIADDKALRQYREEMSNIAGEIEVARSVGDNITVEQLEQDLQDLTNKVNEVVSPAGQSKTLHNPVRNMVVALRNATNYAIDKIEQHSPPLAQHLGEAIKYGQNPGYFSDHKQGWKV